jgi:hypothetical protein
MLFYLQEAGLSEGAGPQNLLINLLGVALFGGLFTLDSRGAEQRVQQRKAMREAQIRAGDREVFVNDQGETMSRLKEVGGVSARRGGAAQGNERGAYLGWRPGGVCERTRGDHATTERGGWGWCAGVVVVRAAARGDQRGADTGWRPGGVCERPRRCHEVGAYLVLRSACDMKGKNWQHTPSIYC